MGLRVKKTRTDNLNLSQRIALEKILVSEHYSEIKTFKHLFKYIYNYIFIIIYCWSSYSLFMWLGLDDTSDDEPLTKLLNKLSRAKKATVQAKRPGTTDIKRGTGNGIKKTNNKFTGGNPSQAPQHVGYALNTTHTHKPTHYYSEWKGGINFI